MPHSTVLHEAGLWAVSPESLGTLNVHKDDFTGESIRGRLCARRLWAALETHLHPSGSQAFPRTSLLLLSPTCGGGESCTSSYWEGCGGSWGGRRSPWAGREVNAWTTHPKPVGRQDLGARRD